MPARSIDFACPNCTQPLAAAERDEVRSWTCQSCGGRAASLATLRKERDTTALAHIWGLARSSAPASGKRCVACARPATRVTLNLADGELVLDVCTMCQMVWFDGDEVERIPKQPQPVVAPAKELPPEAKVAYAQAMASMWQDRIRADNQRASTADGIENLASRLTSILGPLGG